MKKLHESIINPDLYGKIINEQKYMPNQKWHRRISFIKSAIRILGYSTFPLILIDINYMWLSTILLILSEATGIAEELV